MVEKYSLAKNIAEKKFSKDSVLYPFMVCVLYGVLIRFGNYDDLIEEIFLKTDIYLENGSVMEIMERNNISFDLIEESYKDEDMGTSIHGTSNSGYSFETDEEGNTKLVIGDPFIICSLDNIDMNHLLNIFTHELCHLIKGEINGYSVLEDDDNSTYVIRSGLNYFVGTFIKESREFRISSAFEALDEAINCIYTTEVMEEIFALADAGVTDQEVADFIESLDLKHLATDYGYPFIIPLIRKFWSIPSFRESIEKNIVVGDVDKISEEFDFLIGEEQFLNFGYLVDDISSLSEEDYDEDEMKGYLDMFENILRQYKKAIKEYKKTE